MADGARTALATGLDRIARRLTTARLLRGVAGGALAAVAVVAGARIVGTPLPAAAPMPKARRMAAPGVSANA